MNTGSARLTSCGWMMLPITLQFPIRAPRLLLRPLRADDRAAFVRMHDLSRAFFAPWSPTVESAKSSDELFDGQLKRSLDGLQTGKDLRLAAFLVDGRMGGEFNLNEIVHGAFQNAYAGWKVSAEVARQGIGMEGATALLDIAFAPPPVGLGLHRVQANAVPSNAPSVALMQKLGMRYEGLAKRYLKIAGEWRDHVMYAKTVEEHRLTYLA
jgi:[ribosomal protein S5]-alanine N-acetyltransferase